MTSEDDSLRNLKAAIDAIGNLLQGDLERLFHNGNLSAQIAHSEIAIAPVRQKSSRFYGHFLPIRKELILLLANTYRRLFRLTLAHDRQIEGDADHWTWVQLQPAIAATLEWIRDWYVLVCEGENRSIRLVGSVPFVPGQTVSIAIPTTVTTGLLPSSWQVPAWLFQVSPLVGIGPLKSAHVPPNDTEERLSAACSRLVLKGARRVFLWELRAATERVRNEEIAATGAIPVAQSAAALERGRSKHRLHGLKGLGQKKTDLLRYMPDDLTEKQQNAWSMKYEYGLPLAEIAERMGIDRKTAWEHIEAAKRKTQQAHSNEKRRANRAKSNDDL